MLSVVNSPVMLSVIILNVIMLSVIKLNVAMLNVVMLSVVAPKKIVPGVDDAGGDALLAELLVVEESDDGVVLQDGQVLLADGLQDRLPAQISNPAENTSSLSQML